MAQFSIKMQGVTSELYQENFHGTELSGLESKVRSARTGLRWKVASKEQIDSRLKKALGHVENCRTDMKSLHTALSQVIQKYTVTESRLLVDKADGPSINWAAGAAAAVKSEVGEYVVDHIMGTTDHPLLDAVGKTAVAAINPQNPVGWISAAKSWFSPDLKKDRTEFAWSAAGEAGELGSAVGAAKSVKDFIAEPSWKNGLSAVKDITGAVGDVVGKSDVIKKLGNAIKNKSWTRANWSDVAGLVGLNIPKELSTNLGNGRKAFTDSLAKQVGDATPVEGSVVSYLPAVGAVLTTITNGIDNVKENGWTLRSVQETVTETAVDIGKGLLIGAGVAGAFAAAGISAPAVVVGAAAVGVSMLLDVGCKWATKKFTGEEKGVTEVASDFLIDTQDKALDWAAKKVAAPVNSVKAAWSGLTNGIRNAFSPAGAGGLTPALG